MAWSHGSASVRSPSRHTNEGPSSIMLMNLPPAVAQLNPGIAAVPLQPGTTGGQAAVAGHLARTSDPYYRRSSHAPSSAPAFFNSGAVSMSPLTGFSCIAAGCRTRTKIGWRAAFADGDADRGCGKKYRPGIQKNNGRLGAPAGAWGHGDGPGRWNHQFDGWLPSTRSPVIDTFNSVMLAFLKPAEGPAANSRIKGLTQAVVAFQRAARGHPPVSPSCRRRTSV